LQPPASGRSTCDALTGWVGTPLTPTHAALDLKSTYRNILASRGFVEDAAQLSALEHLQVLGEALHSFRDQRKSVLRRVFRAPAVPRGLWMWGGVGRGKSLLMDLFFDAVALRRKGRMHFHEFMRAVHRELDALKGRADPLDAVAVLFAGRYRLLCFDEFHVSDIADAMILERLLRGMFGHGMVVVTTSNYQPAKLYPGGLHRDRILPAIALLESHLDCLQVDTGIDYRRRALSQVPVYLSPLSAEVAARLERNFQRLADGPIRREVILEISHRPLRCVALGGGVAWIGFGALCGQPRSQLDYLELSERFHTILLSEVPRMGPAMASEARRFVWLVDVLYDRGIKLLLSAEVSADELYREGAMAQEFVRTVSRLLEMQTEAYRDRPLRSSAAVSEPANSGRQ